MFGYIFVQLEFLQIMILFNLNMMYFHAHQFKVFNSTLSSGFVLYPDSIDHKWSISKTDFKL